MIDFIDFDKIDRVDVNFVASVYAALRQQSEVVTAVVCMTKPLFACLNIAKL